MNQELNESLIVQFVSVAQLELKTNKKIQEFFSKNKDKRISNIEFEYLPEAFFLRLVANDAFFEAVNIMNALLFPSSKNEHSFDEYIEKYHSQDNKIKNQLESVKSKYKYGGFIKIRHNITAHKSSKHFNFGFGRMLPIDHLNLGVNPKQVEMLLDIIDELSSYFPEWLKDIYEVFTPREGGRPYSQQELGLDYIFESIEKKYKL